MYRKSDFSFHSYPQIANIVPVFKNAGMKKYRWLLIALLSFFLICLITGFIFTLSYENTVIRYIKRYLDKHLITEVEISKINFSVFKRFPNASVELKNVMAKSGLGISTSEFLPSSADTLLFARSVFFEFSIPGIIRGDYGLKNLRIADAKLNLLADRKGNTNYLIWKRSQKDTGEYNIKLQNLVLSNILISYTDLRNQVQIETHSKKLAVKAKFTDKGNHLLVRGYVSLLHLGIGKDVSYSGKYILADIDLFFNKTDYRFNPSSLLYGKTIVYFEGNIRNAAQTTINLSINSDKANLEDLSEFVPVPLTAIREDYEISGLADIKGTLTGPAGRNAIPRIHFNFGINKGIIQNRHNRRKITALTLDGIYTTGTSGKVRISELNLKGFSAQLGKSMLTGAVKFIGSDPTSVEGSFSADCLAEELKDFLNLDTLQEVSGRIKAEIGLSGRLMRLGEMKGSDFWPLLKKGRITVSDLSFRYTNARNACRQVNGTVLVDDNIQFRDFSWFLGNSDFTANAVFKGLPEYLNKKGSCDVEAEFHSNRLDLNSILPEAESDTGSVPVKFPADFTGRVNFTVNTFIFRKFVAKNVTASGTYIPKKIRFHYFKLIIPDGYVEGSADIRQLDNLKFAVDCSSELYEVDIQKLFYAFNNFGQDVILDENLRGKLTGNIDFNALWDKRINFEGSTITAKSDFEIVNGELLNYEPMLGLSKFIAVDELRNIKFKTLKNQILVADQKVIIPEMDIHSSAFNIKGSGIHKFDNSYDYRIQVELNELLTRKAGKKRAEIDKFGVIEDDGLGGIRIPIKIIGKGTEYEVSLDKKKALGIFRKNISEEKEEMKRLLKNDNGGNDEINPDADPNKRFIIEWDEGNDKKDFKFDKKEQKTNKKPEFIIEWDDEDDVQKSDSSGNKEY